MAVEEPKDLEEVPLDCQVEHYQFQEAISANFSYVMTFRRQTRNPRLETMVGWIVALVLAVL